ncbi:NUDIX domain-containing protein [Loktanella sp. F6476L]|uniref:NUDIX domain-containing protein n=1 Tax=Loktanella sp. F6476L TaxID=2926405 RepID=UPI001FF3AFBA|nr:NUDIX domain-containing protein [Loktanella sp. F6476L]
MSVFIYGTLLDATLRCRLLGRNVSAKAATLSGYVLREQKSAPLPAIVAQFGTIISGLLLDDLTAQEVAKLDAYELPFDYNPIPAAINVEGLSVEAQVYLPGPSVDISDREWSLERWQDQSGGLSREMAVEIGSYDPPLAGDALRRQWNMIALRASVRLRAQEQDAPTRVRTAAQPSDFAAEHSGPLSGDFFRLAQLQVTHRTFQDDTAGPLPREVFIGTDAALLLPYDPVTDHVLLVEQIRMGPMLRGAANPWALEPIAGMIDAGETPEEAAQRESEEEAGLQGVALQKMFSYYPSTGSSTDYFYCYLGLCDLPEPTTYTGGLATEAEDLRLHVIPFDTAFSLIETGEAENAAIVSMLLWLAQNRSRLRGTA